MSPVLIKSRVADLQLSVKLKLTAQIGYVKERGYLSFLYLTLKLSLIQEIKCQKLLIKTHLSIPNIHTVRHTR